MAKILIVDDDPGLRTMFRLLLSVNGHETHFAADGQEALELVKRDAFDLMITDLRMPNMDGMHLLQAVKAIAFSMPVIVITAYSSRETAAEAVNLGASAYISKPFTLSEVRAAIGRALDARADKAPAQSSFAGVGRESALSIA